MNIVVKAITRALLVSQILFVDLKLCYMYPIMHAQKSQIATRVLLGRPMGVNRKNCHISCEAMDPSLSTQVTALPTFYDDGHT